MDLGLENRVAFVVAANQGLGFATARELVREGARVAFCGRNEERNQQAARALRELAGASEKVLALQGDVTLDQDIRRMFGEVEAHFGGLDLLVTNAGGPPAGRFEELDSEKWGKAMRLTLLSVVRMIETALPLLERSEVASLLTITSISAKQPIPSLLLSNVLRPAVVGLTKTLSQELAPGIRVNSVLPGWTRTERVGELLQDRAARSGRSEEEEAAVITRTVPLGRMAQPEELGRAAAFLLSPAASYLTGVMLQVDGGAYSGLL